jgi:hypothetical protein
MCLLLWLVLLLLLLLLRQPGKDGIHERKAVL